MVKIAQLRSDYYWLYDNECISGVLQQWFSSSPRLAAVVTSKLWTVDCGQKCLNRFSIKWYIFPQHNENIIILPWSASETSYLLCCSQGSQGSQGSAAVNKTINSVTSVRIAGDLPGPGHRADTSSRLGKDVFYAIIFYRSIYTKIYRVVLDNAKTR